MKNLRLLPGYAAFFALAGAPLSGCAGVFGSDVVESFHAVTTHSPATIAIHNPVGKIEIDGWNKPGVRIDAEKRGPTLDDVHAIKIAVVPNGDTLTITSDLGSQSNGRSVSYVIHAPPRTHLDLDESVGGITLRGFSGDIDATVATGGIKATLATLAAPQHVTLDVSVGGIKVALPSSANASVTATTSVGGVKSDFPLTIDRSTVGADASGTIGHGGAKLELRASTGGIDITRE